MGMEADAAAEGFHDKHRDELLSALTMTRTRTGDGDQRMVDYVIT
jgi:hypothetical protein